MQTSEILKKWIRVNQGVGVPVQLLLELEANWLDQNVNELEFELHI